MTGEDEKNASNVENDGLDWRCLCFNTRRKRDEDFLSPTRVRDLSRDLHRSL